MRFGNGHSQQAGRAHLREQFWRVALIAEVRDHTRLEDALREAARGIANLPLLLAQLIVEREWIGPVELRHGTSSAASSRRGEDRQLAWSG